METHGSVTSWVTFKLKKKKKKFFKNYVTKKMEIEKQPNYLYQVALFTFNLCSFLTFQQGEKGLEGWLSG